jgi:uncharacterized protein (TIGR03435 family)
MKRAPLTALLAATLSVVHGQSPAPPAFEAASIKPGSPGRAGGGLNLFPARIRIVNASLKFCVQVAWNVKDFQVSGATGWMDGDRYDIDAVAASPFKEGEYRTMLQALMADRFGLVIHRETQDKAGYALVAGRNGPKLPPPVEGPDILFGRTPSGDITLKATSASMNQLAGVLSSTLGATVVDRTGIEGRFDVSLQYTPDPATQPLMTKSGVPVPPPPSDAASGPSIFSALQGTLGLKLEARKVPVEVIVIDHANRPSDN